MSSLDEPGSADPLVGALLEGKYRIKHRLGSGGMGTVYLATDVAIERPVAIKILNEVQSSDATAVQRFQREATSMKSLNHINVVRLNSVGFHENRSFLVLEYVEGQTLAQRLKQQDPMTLTECLNVWQQVIAGVQHAHENGVLHRDLKPNNILITKLPDTDLVVVKVMDFGVSLLLDESAQKLTQTGSFVGTAPYMSPEQLAGMKITEASDQYSIGCLMYECLFGRPPFSGENFFAIALAHSSEELLIPERTVSGAEVPTAMSQCLTKVLAKTADERFSSLLKLSEMLARIEQNPNQSLPPEELRRASQITANVCKGSWKSTVGIAACLLLLGFAGIYYLAMQRETGRRAFGAELLMAQASAEHQDFSEAEQHIDRAFDIAKANGISKAEVSNTVESICNSAFRNWDTVPRRQWTAVGRITLKAVRLTQETTGDDVAAMRLVAKAFERLATGSSNGVVLINDTTPVAEELLANPVTNNDYGRLKHQVLLMQYAGDLGALARGYIEAAKEPGLDAATKQRYLLSAQRLLNRSLWLAENDLTDTPLSWRFEGKLMLGDVLTQLGKHDEAKANYKAAASLKEKILKDTVQEK